MYNNRVIEIVINAFLSINGYNYYFIVWNRNIIDYYNKLM